jgi:cyanate lyase
MLSKKEAAQAVLSAKVRLGLTWSQLAEAVGRPVAWTTSALLGQQPMTADQAKAAGSLLDLGEDVVAALQLQPTRGALDVPIPTDPTVYRFYEILQVYGPTIKELIHEEFGDGIMSAINFRLHVRRAADPAGDRVIVVLDGKFLPYQWWDRKEAGRVIESLHWPVVNGKKVNVAAAADLKRVPLELGGNDAAIVLPDADPGDVV